MATVADRARLGVIDDSISDGIRRINATIANGGTTSSTIDMGRHRLSRITFPASFTGTSVSFQVSPDGENWSTLFDALGNTVSIAAAASRSVLVSLADWLGMRYVRIVSNGTEAADRVLQLTIVE